MCGYCEREKENIFIKELPNLYLVIFKNSLEVGYYDDRTEWNYNETTINYCPMCGRKL